MSLPILSALLVSFTFYPWGQEWLVWVAWVPLLVWLADPTLHTAQAFKGLLLVGVVYHFVLLLPFLSIGWWGWGTAAVQGLQDYFTYQRLFMIGVVVVVTVGEGLFLTMIGLCGRSSLSRPLTALVVVPSAWILCLEYLAHRGVFGSTWGQIGNRLYSHDSLRQVASLSGVYGLSFLILMVNALVASWMVQLQTTFRNKPSHRRVSTSLVIATILVFIIFGGSVVYGRTRLQRKFSEGQAMRVALLQGARAEYFDDDFTAEGLDKLYGPMVERAAQAHANFILLPETVWLRPLALEPSSFDDHQPPLSVSQVQAALFKQLQDKEATVILGMDVHLDGRTYNATTFWSAERLIGLYRKRRLVPFSEYRPALLAPWIPRNLIHGGAFAYTPGHGSQLVRVGSVTVGPFICQEVAYPELVRQTAQDGAALLVTTGNDGVFSSPAVALEQSHLAQLRAAENGRYLVRCMKTGISAIIDPQGRVIARGALNARTIVLGTVHPVTELTWYTRYGDWIVWISGLILLVAFLSRMLTHRYPSS